MREKDLDILACPHCKYGLVIHSITESQNGQWITGQLKCNCCSTIYPISKGIPRFVSMDNYAASFGLEWSRHAQTQYDSYSKTKLSETRFFKETRWPLDLRGEIILEIGSGSGRFTEQAASTGADIVSMDYSYAVDANFQSNGQKANVLIVQANIYELPFRDATFDKIFCFGVLQHTPDVHGAFTKLPPMLKPGGELVVDVYKKTIIRTLFNTKYYIRPFIRNLHPEHLYTMVKWWVDLMWPICSLIRKIPRIGYRLNWRLLVADYSWAGLKGELLKEWAYLDTFDMLSSRFDYPQTIPTVRRWFTLAGLSDIEVNYGFNGIEGRGRKPI